VGAYGHYILVADRKCQRNLIDHFLGSATSYLPEERAAVLQGCFDNERCSKYQAPESLQQEPDDPLDDGETSRATLPVARAAESAAVT